MPKHQATFTPWSLRSSHLPTPIVSSKFLSSISLGRSVITRTFTRWSVIVPPTIDAFLSIIPYQGITSEAVVSYSFTMLYLVTLISRSFYVKAMFWSSHKRAAGYKKKQCFYARNGDNAELGSIYMEIKLD